MEDSLQETEKSGKPGDVQAAALSSDESILKFVRIPSNDDQPPIPWPCFEFDSLKQ
jgi:hypothetical protein